VSLSDAVKDPNSPFHACDEHIDTFEKYAGQHGYPAIVLASIAMQESTCKADTVGGAGEQGLMQITEEKCAGAPDGNCRDPDFNIRTGADFFQGLLDKHDGDFLISLGAYNGWQKGMSLDEAKTQFGGNCRTQRNLDYLFQNLNGWYQNENVYGGRKLGKFFNLDVC
jgi:soluble lytic murein transglycosylase-like protein